eukprot:CAMPEP_0181339290 /NCGR_PEP_ID=MMETSP1101-20121128/29166_1 /TAXON_ID=46948 /ORGANISM="Rhodomonas abbreviata, Strain Caron Lab Isolate" /LENGTH=83 /DNA_ID=CAMNT_0023450227 /DNA_START=16 /DNA_END=265 /DNA_ORIENTATION=-
MGMDAVRYLIADRHVAPPEHRDLFHEHLVMMPTSYHFYSIRRNRFDSDELPPLGGGEDEREDNNGGVQASVQKKEEADQAVNQ